METEDLSDLLAAFDSLPELSNRETDSDRDFPSSANRSREEPENAQEIEGERQTGGERETAGEGGERIARLGFTSREGSEQVSTPSLRAVLDFPSLIPDERERRADGGEGDRPRVAFLGSPEESESDGARDSERESAARGGEGFASQGGVSSAAGPRGDLRPAETSPVLLETAASARGLSGGEERVNDPFDLDDTLGAFFDAALPPASVESWTDFLLSQADRPPAPALPCASPAPRFLAFHAPGPPISPPPVRASRPVASLSSRSPPLPSLPSRSSSSSVAAPRPCPPSGLSVPGAARRQMHALPLHAAVSSASAAEGLRREVGNSPAEREREPRPGRDVPEAPSARPSRVHEHSGQAEADSSPSRLRRRPLSLDDYFSVAQQSRRRCTGTSQVSTSNGDEPGRQATPEPAASLPLTTSRVRVAPVSSGSSASSGCALLTDVSQGPRAPPVPASPRRIHPSSPFPPPISPPSSPLRARSSPSSPPSPSSASSSASFSSSNASVPEGASRMPFPSVSPQHESVRGAPASPPEKTRQLPLRGAPLSGSKLLAGACLFFGKAQECPVCLTEFEAVAEVASVDDCRHAFCLRCISKWVRQSRSCPLCRGQTTTVCLWKARHAKPGPGAKNVASKAAEANGASAKGETDAGGIRAFAFARRLQPDRNNILKPVSLATKLSRSGRETRSGRRVPTRRAKASPTSRPAARLSPSRSPSSVAPEQGRDLALATSREEGADQAIQVDVLEGPGVPEL
ncbi:putative zinc finger (C3HC4 type RING finger) protein [Neospora caninum Liverpool]|uniref:Putative zinc finger (C3HC4 type RING finger) protein n=1 Tax=Neospora caninum (strain Liverpool) TaxID=572307 RepID=F0VEI3_NEOCL|nr:putative zinc finger (C3HC4 type RING finger) protein [Neospora caninum Liverpool]CBZ52127.1 putative zinc finger (C3HC4 type RING finger) protein [Neospora caninum Liverpool]CEL66089.1 TPA: zinc finger (C3HC4 type RING finger) protein,putative [Neospora caninum Liverpool]|eukprot:XP_003882159.1 putative zinc finger (C3HC4 type RING finger) protein [Neospora caninum Liverpool]